MNNNHPFNLVYKNKLYKLYCGLYKNDDFDLYFKSFLKNKSLKNGNHSFILDNGFELKVEILDFN